jgi:hypothetical protein
MCGGVCRIHDVLVETNSIRDYFRIDFLFLKHEFNNYRLGT